VRLKEFDHQIGAAFGLVKGALLCLVITFFVVTLSEPGRQAVLKSTSGKYIAVAIQKGTPLMPEEVRNVLGKYIDELDRKLDPATPADAPADAPMDELDRRLLEREKSPLDNSQPKERSSRRTTDWGRAPAEADYRYSR